MGKKTCHRTDFYSMKFLLAYIDIFLEVTHNLLHSTIGIIKALASLWQLGQNLAVCAVHL